MASTGTIKVLDKKKAPPHSRKRYFWWLLGLFAAMVFESYARELGGQGTIEAEKFLGMDFPAKINEWYQYFTQIYIPAHIDFIKTGARNLGLFVSGNGYLMESLEEGTSLQQVVPQDFASLLIKAGFAAKVGTASLALLNFIKTVFRDVKSIFGGKK